MSDKLEWMNQHLVLLSQLTVQDVIDKELYKPDTELKRIAARYPDSEDYVRQLALSSKHKEACTFLAYSLHHRAAVWWGYLCVLDLLRELTISPFKPRDIEDIGKPKPFVIPDWAKAPEPPQVDPSVYKMIADCQDNLKQIQTTLEANLSPEAVAFGKQLMAMADEAIVAKYGMTLQQAFDKVLEQGKQNHFRDYVIDKENSPLFKEVAALKAKIEQTRQETIKLVKAAVPKRDEEALKKTKADSLDAVYRYIVSPDEKNASICLQLGNQAPDVPEGLLSLVAFWSYGDLAPDNEKMVVRTPQGLMANGLSNLLLMLALQQGGEYKFEQRFERYYTLGYKVGIGLLNWGESVENAKIPHQNLMHFEEDLLTEIKLADPKAKSPVQQTTQAHVSVNGRFKADPVE